MSTDLLIAFVSSGALAAVINIVFMAIKEWQDRRKGLRAAMRILLDDRVAWLGEKYLRDGEITASNLKIFMKLHQAYHDLGGNGYHDALLEAVKKLPIKG